MDDTKIITYIAEGKERELLDKLSLYSFETFDVRLKNFLKILLILLEKANDVIAPRQLIYKSILNILPILLSKKEELDEFTVLLKSLSLTPNVKTAYLVRELIIGVEDKKFDDAEYEEEKISNEQLENFKKEMIGVNISFLKNAIEQKFNHDNILCLFYNCVEKLEAERRIVINDEAIILFRDYLKSYPTEYIEGFIRPLFSGGINDNFPEYYLHVAEPFNTQIFDDEFSFENFLNLAKSKEVDNYLIDDVERFYEELNYKKVIDGNKSIQIKNPLNTYGLELKYKKHRNVRPELRD